MHLFKLQPIEMHSMRFTEKFDVEPVATPKMKLGDVSDAPLAGSWKPSHIRVDMDEATPGRTITFGSKNPHGVEINNSHVDPYHARLGIDTDGAFIIDSSKTGTYIVRNIDGKQVVSRVENGFKTYIPEGAEVWLGHPSSGYKIPLKNSIPVAQPITVPFIAKSRRMGEFPSPCHKIANYEP